MERANCDLKARHDLDMSAKAPNQSTRLLRAGTLAKPGPKLGFLALLASSASSPLGQGAAANGRLEAELVRSSRRHGQAQRPAPGGARGARSARRVRGGCGGGRPGDHRGREAAESRFSASEVCTSVSPPPPGQETPVYESAPEMTQCIHANLVRFRELEPPEIKPTSCK